MQTRSRFVFVAMLVTASGIADANQPPQVAVPISKDGPTIVVPADGEAHSWSKWNHGSSAEPAYQWGTTQVKPDGSYTHWNYGSGEYSWGRIDVK